LGIGWQALAELGIELGLGIDPMDLDTGPRHLGTQGFGALDGMQGIRESLDMSGPGTIRCRLCERQSR
jgi:hypothetical protein